MVVTLGGTRPTVWATGVPTTSSLNFTLGQIVANVVTVQLPTTGDLQVYFGGGSGTVDLVVDVVGYYVPSNAGPRDRPVRRVCRVPRVSPARSDPRVRASLHNSSR